MDVRKRGAFLENIIQKTELSAERLSAHLNYLGHIETFNLAHTLKSCSMTVFLKYIEILSIGRATAVDDHTLPFIASSMESTTTCKRGGNVVPLQVCDEPTSKINTHEPDGPPQKSNANTLAISHSPYDDATKPADSQLCRLVHSLPPELFNKMLQTFLHTVFGPRKIYLGVEHLNLHVLGALNRAMYAKQQSILLSESVWVIGQGNYGEGIGFLARMPMAMLKSIRKIEMSLTGQDYECPSLKHYFALPNNTTSGTGRLDCLLDYIKECHKTKYKLMMIWDAKIDAVMSLKLNELTLNFSDAYGPDGEFLGRWFADTTHCLSAGTAAKFLILGMDGR